MKWLIVLLTLIAPNALGMEFPTNHSAVQASWGQLCSLTECGTVEAPMVIFKDTYPYLGYYYYGTNVVFIAEGCLAQLADAHLCQGIVLHEMAHYLLWTQTRNEDGCEQEKFAWGIYNHYLLEVGRPDLLRLNWREVYPECVLSPDDSTSSVTP